MYLVRLGGIAVGGSGDLVSAVAQLTIVAVTESEMKYATMPIELVVQPGAPLIELFQLLKQNSTERAIN